MSYRVNYGSVRKMRGREKRTARVAALTGLFFLAFLLLVNARWPQGKALLCGAVLPEKVLTAAAALEDLAQDLQGDGDLSDALAVFLHHVGAHETDDPA